MSKRGRWSSLHELKIVDLCQFNIKAWWIFPIHLTLRYCLAILFFILIFTILKQRRLPTQLFIIHGNIKRLDVFQTILKLKLRNICYVCAIKFVPTEILDACLHFQRNDIIAEKWYYPEKSQRGKRIKSWKSTLVIVDEEAFFKKIFCRGKPWL